MRRAVGLIGILMLFSLMLGNYVIFRGWFVLRSISRYYHSDMLDLFVQDPGSRRCFLKVGGESGEISREVIVFGNDAAVK